jgi:hypothetical protein
LQAEFDEFLSQCAGERDEFGRGAVVHNGLQRRREVLTCLGPIGVQVPITALAHRGSGGVSLGAGAAVRAPGEVAR